MNADEVIGLLGLDAHPEGGWFRETWRDHASSAIWYLLRAGERSHWHRVLDSVEVWHHYFGDGLTLSIAQDGVASSSVLGSDLAAGERPQIAIPAGAWQTATPVDGGPFGYTLVGCTVAPPFRFDAFELGPEGWTP